MHRCHPPNRFELRSRQVPRAKFHRRRGLAPLELTLALPMLVFLMALMIDFGVAGAWKVRTQANTRYAAWRTVNARTGEYNPTPRYWPASAPLTTNAGLDLWQSSQLWDAQPALLCPCIRGPQLTAPSAEVAVNVPGRMEMDGTVLEGNAVLERPVPLLKTALPGGKFRFNLKQDVFDNQWQFYSLGIGWNTDIRADVWWDIEHADLSSLDGAVDSSLQMLNANLQVLQSNPNQQDLYPLDNDDEFRRYESWRPPDFYPRLSGMCESNPDTVYTSIVSRQHKDGSPNRGSLLSRIDNLPCTMSGSFEDLYKKWICELEMCGFSDNGIDPLRQRYKDLAQFMQAQKCNGAPSGQLTRCECPEKTNCACPPSPIGVGH
jgi:hypothetical protein